MRGEVLHYDDAQGFGFITGADGNRYTFRREDIRGQAALAKGAVIEFEGQGGQARSVFPIHSGSSVPSIGVGIRQDVSAGMAGVQPAGSPFGRNAVHAPQAPDLSLWGYFRNALTVNYANFRDRARRKEYWGFYLFWTIAFVALCGGAAAIDAASGNFDDFGPIVTGVAAGLFVLATFIPCLAMVIRRQHDIGLSGWFYLLVFIPYIGSLIIFVFSLIPSQKHDNKWGPMPAGISPPQPYGAPAA